MCIKCITGKYEKWYRDLRQMLRRTKRDKLEVDFFFFLNFMCG